MAEWWDLEGKFKPLHMLNPCRLDYITQQISMEFDRDLSADLPFKGLRILDIGCGGGLLCEPMARLGATVVGADAAAGNIPVAKLHAEQSGLNIDYRHITAEALAEAQEQFDVVLNMEVVEHVASPPAYLFACQQLLRPGGLHICSTLNRNSKSFLFAIIGAEWVMRWLPKGTHDWNKFITPDELFALTAKVLSLIKWLGAGPSLRRISASIMSLPASSPPRHRWTSSSVIHAIWVEHS